MQPEAKPALEDVRLAGTLILEFVGGKTFSDYEQSALLRSAVERQFEVVGEALNRLGKIDLDTAQLIPDRKRIIAFRNILVHGYDVVDIGVVWDVVMDSLPALLQCVLELLGEGP